MKNVYLKATGSACYNSIGIVFPAPIVYFDLKQFLRDKGAREIFWQKQFGWCNQPDVLIFKATDEVIKSISISIEAMKLPLIVSSLWESQGIETK